METRVSYLEERVLLLRLELVGPEEFDTAGGLFLGEALVGTLQQLEDVVEDDSLQIDLLLIVKVLCFQLDLTRHERVR